MGEDSSLTSVSKTSISIFALSLLVLAFWFIGETINVYHLALIGAIFEFLWLPMLAALFVLQILSFVLWAQRKFNMKSFYLYSLVISVVTILFMVTQ